MRINRSAARFGVRSLIPIGEATAVAGVVVLCVGAGMPWANCVIFGVPLHIPGLLLGGGLPASVGLLSFYYLRRLPLLSLAIAIAALALGLYFKSRVGMDMARTLLHIASLFAPLNSRLAQVGVNALDPISGIGPPQSYLGEGIAWTIWGGVVLTLGTSLRFAGQRLPRTCLKCGHAWSVGRAGDVRFCPRCGANALFAPRACTVCYHLLRPKDRFCVRCGTLVVAPLPVAAPLKE